MKTVWHHKVPAYMGGADEPENLIELTYKEHATAHFLLWLQYHDERDWLAWRGFEKIIGKEEIFVEKSKIGGMQAVHQKKGIHGATAEQKKEWAKMGAKANYAKNKEKIDAVLRANAKRNAELGLGGCEAGKWIWITDGVNNKKVLKTDKIPEGWYKGRNKNGAKAYTYCDYVEQDKKQCTYCKEWFVPRVLARWHNEKCSKWVTNGFEEKQIHFTDIVEEGWQEGRYKDTFTVETRTSNYPNPVMKKHCPVCDQLLDAGNFKIHVKSKKCSLTYEYADNKKKGT